jgi:lipopolysaccharide export system permease protein
MILLARHVARAVITFTALTMTVLLVLFALYLFANEQSDIGTGSYGMLDAAMFALLSLPRYVFDVLPIGALIGALLGLNNLARGSELTVMRAAGVSTMRLGGWAALAGLLLAVVTWLIGDFIAPPLEQYARQQKTFAKFKEISLTGKQNAWAKDGNVFVSVQQQSTQNEFGGVYVYRFDDNHRLVSVGHATAADVSTANEWQLRDWVESRIESQGDDPGAGQRVVTERAAVHVLNTQLAPEFLGLAAMEPDVLPGRLLFSLIRHQRANGLDARVYETAFWARIARTCALVFVVMLAVPFALFSQRTGSGGVRMVLGVMVGVGFFVLAKLLENGGRVFDLSPITVAWAPTLLLAAVTMVALARAK